MRKFIVFLLLSSLLVFGVSALMTGDTQGSDGTVGVATCKACHAKHYESYAGSIHARKAIPGSPANRNACETCHGPGAPHLEKMGAGGAGIFLSFLPHGDPPHQFLGHGEAQSGGNLL